MKLFREMCVTRPYSDTLNTATPLQLGLGGSPWRVTVASVLICRTRRTRVEPILWDLFHRWPSPQHLAVGDGLEELIQPLGLFRARARSLIRLSQLWDTTQWTVLEDLPGVGRYVADAVRLCCFAARTPTDDKALQRVYLDLAAGGYRVRCAFCRYDPPRDSRPILWGVCPSCYQGFVASAAVGV